MSDSKLKVIILVFLLILFLSFLSAHPITLIDQKTTLTLRENEVKVNLEISYSALMVLRVWRNYDLDGNKLLDEDEMKRWMEDVRGELYLEFDSKPLKLEIEDFHFPLYEDFMAGTESLSLWFNVPLNPERGEHRILYVNNHYALDSQFTMILIVEEGFEILDIEEGYNSLMVLLEFGKSQESERVEFLKEKTYTGTKRLEDLLKSSLNVEVFTLGLGIAVVLGALHALTPGHGKAVVAAYLVGSKGSHLHAILLGLIVTITHTSSVLLLGVLTLSATQFILPEKVIPLFELLSGILITSIGVILLLRRLKAENHPHKEIQMVGFKDLLTLGVSGGIVPCPDALAILLVAVALNKIFLGLTLILAFSLGLASVLILIGTFMVTSKTKLERFSTFKRIGEKLPLISALFVVLLGLVITLKVLLGGGIF
ncbi:MAG: nickel/cobalt transporter [Candidatus Methanofastidiosia archaeon]